MFEKTHLVHCGGDLELKGTKYDSWNKVDLSVNPDYEFIPGHRYLVFWNDSAGGPDQQPYEIITSRIHLGPRREGFYDLTKMDYVRTRNDVFFKFAYKRYQRELQWLTKDEFESIGPHLESIKKKLRNAELESGISKRTGKEWFRLSYDKLKGADDDLLGFMEREDYVKDPPKMEFYKIIRTVEDINNSFDYFMSHEQFYGLDYETNSFPMEDPEFFTMGVGISGVDGIGAYFDLEWMQLPKNRDCYDIFINRYKEFLEKYENSVTYNNGFEMRVTYLLLGKINLFDEGATINKLDGLVSKRFSLKFTAMKNLHVASWDDDFELLTNDLLPNLFGWVQPDVGDGYYLWQLEDDGLPALTLSDFVSTRLEPTYDDIPKTYLNDEGAEMIYYDYELDQLLAKEVNKFHKNIKEEFESASESVIKVRDELGRSRYYKNNPIWVKLCELYPDDIPEFERLISSYYGYSFKCIPSTILGKYCCMDSFHTVLLKKLSLERYPQRAWDCYNNNMRLEALLNLTGIYLDEPLRAKMDEISVHRIVYGKLHTLKFVLDTKLRWFKDIIIEDVPEVKNLIKSGYDPTDSKSLLMNHLSEGSDYGIDEEALLKIIPDSVLDIYKDYIREYVYRLESKHSRSRKVFTEINSALEERWKPEYGDNYCKYTVNGVDYVINVNYDLLYDYYFIKDSLSEIDNFLKQLSLESYEVRYLTDLSGSKIEMPDMIEYLNSILNVTSPKESVKFKMMIWKEFKPLILYSHYYDYDCQDLEGHHELSLEEVSDDIIQEELGKGFELLEIENLAKKLIQTDDKIKESIAWKYYQLHKDPMILAYSYLKFEDGYLVPTGEKDDKGNPLMVWSEGAENFHKYVSDQSDEWLDHITYYSGYWTVQNNEDQLKEIHENIDEIDVTERSILGLAKLNYCYYSSKKYTKNHTTYLNGQYTSYTIDSHNPNKDGISPEWFGGNVPKMHPPFYALSKKSKRWSAGTHTIPSKSEVKRVVKAPPGYCISYFDISGAEVRFISYESQDPFMLENYRLGLDPYIEFARRYLFPDRADDIEFLKGWRSTVKIILLGTLYGMGPDTLAENIDMTPEEALRVQNLFFSKATGIRDIITEMSTWALEHPGYVKSFLGDVLILGDDDGEDRLSRLGVNQHIQNASSTTLGDGFFQCIQPVIHKSEPMIGSGIIMPLNVVHDSAQNYFETKLVFDLYPYYHKYMSDYCFDKYGVRYEFDLEVGANYFDMVKLKQLDSDTLQMKGNYLSIKGVLDKMAESGMNWNIDSLKTDSKKVEKVFDIPYRMEGNNYSVDELFKPEIQKSPVEMFFGMMSGYAVYNLDYSKYTCIISR